MGERPQSIADWRGPLLAPDPKPAAAKAARARIGDVLGLKRGTEPAEALHVAAANEAVIPLPPDAPQPPGQLLEFVDGLRKPKRSVAPAAAPETVETPVPAKLSDALAAVEKPSRFGFGFGGAPKIATPAAEVVALTPVVPMPMAVVEPLTPSLSQQVERRRPRKRSRGWFFLRSPWRGLLLKFGTGLAVASAFTIYQERWPLSIIAGPPATGRHAATKPVTLVPRADSSAIAHDPGALLQPASQQLVGPTGTVTDVHYLGESQRVVTIGTDATLRLWDANSGALLRSIALPEGAATTLAAQEQLALTGHSDGTLSLWDLAKGERIAVFRRDAVALTAVAFAPETDHLIAAAKDGSIVVWNRRAPSAPVQINAEARGAVTALVRVAARDAVAFTLADNTVQLSSSESLGRIRSYHGHNAKIIAIGSPENGRALASATSDGQIRVWSTASTRLIKSFQAHAGPITAMSYAPSGSTLASIGADGILKIWDAKRGRLLASAQQAMRGVHAISFAADGRHLATAEASGTVRLWDAAAVKLARD